MLDQGLAHSGAYEVIYLSCLSSILLLYLVRVFGNCTLDRGFPCSIHMRWTLDYNLENLIRSRDNRVTTIGRITPDLSQF